jgi:hypothetical protein
VAIGGHSLPDSEDCQDDLCRVCHVLHLSGGGFRVLSRYFRPGDNFAKRTGRRMSGDRPSQRLNRGSPDWGTALSDQAQVRTTTSSTA